MYILQSSCTQSCTSLRYRYMYMYLINMDEKRGTLLVSLKDFRNFKAGDVDSHVNHVWGCIQYTCTGLSDNNFFYFFFPLDFAVQIN